MTMRWCLALGALLVLPGTAAAVPVDDMRCDALIQAVLFDDLKDLREDAAEELGERPCSEAIPFLIDVAFHDPSWEVRETAVYALAELGTPAAMDGVQRLLEADGSGPVVRDRALRVLLDETPSRAGPGALRGLVAYRTLRPRTAERLLAIAREHDPALTGDLAVLIARDPAADRALRLAALDTAGALAHPREFEACLGFLGDRDARLRERCTAAATRPGLPSAQIVPLLEQMATSRDGAVRAGALDALRFHAHPGLVPLAHDRVLNERHLAAWGRALDLLEVVADERSTTVIGQVLERDRVDLSDDTVVRLIHLLLRIGDPGARPALEALAAERPASPVTEAAAEALALLDDPAARQRWAAGWAPRVAYEVWDPAAPDAPLPPLRVTRDEDGTVRLPDELDEGCEPARLTVTVTTRTAFDLRVDGVTLSPVGGSFEDDTLQYELPPGAGHVRVASRRGTPKAWSAGLLDTACGEQLWGEISVARGLVLLEQEPDLTPFLDQLPEGAPETEHEDEIESEPETSGSGLPSDESADHGDGGDQGERPSDEATEADRAVQPVPPGASEADRAPGASREEAEGGGLEPEDEIEDEPAEMQPDDAEVVPPPESG